MDCSKSAGIYCCGTRRTDSVSDEIDKLLGIKINKAILKILLSMYSIFFGKMDITLK
ncbi:MAG: hypothetical protein ACLRPW_00800 [Intestinibacter sp.]